MPVFPCHESTAEIQPAIARLGFGLGSIIPRPSPRLHIVGATLDRVYLESTTTNVLCGVQTQLVPAGRDMVFDVKFREAGITPS